MKNIYILIYTLFFSISFSACNQDDALRPVIANIAPLSGDYGETVTISGSNFSEASTDLVVLFGDVEAEITSTSTTEVTVKVPVGANTGSITVQANGQGKQSEQIFEVTSGSWQMIDNSFQMNLVSPALFAIGEKLYIHTREQFSAFDVKTKKWTSLSPISPEDYSNAGFGVFSWATESKGYCYFYGRLLEYNPVTDAWQEKPEGIFSNSNPPWRQFYMGKTNKSYFVHKNNIVTFYDHSTDLWGRLTDEYNFPKGLAYRGFSAANEGRAFVLCEFSNNDYEIWKFSPENRSEPWHLVPHNPNMQYPSLGISPIFQFIGNDIYCASANQELWYFSDLKQAWYRKADLPVFRTNSTIQLATHDKIYWGFGADENDRIAYELFGYSLTD